MNDKQFYKWFKAAENKEHFTKSPLLGHHHLAVTLITIHCDRVHSFIHCANIHSFIHCANIHSFIHCDNIHSFIHCDNIHRFIYCYSVHRFTTSSRTAAGYGARLSRIEEYCTQ